MDVEAFGQADKGGRSRIRRYYSNILKNKRPKPKSDDEEEIEFGWTLMRNRIWPAK